MGTSLENILTYQALCTPKKKLMVGVIRSMLWSRPEQKAECLTDYDQISTSSVWHAFISHLLPTSGTALLYQLK